MTAKQGMVHVNEELSTGAAMLLSVSKQITYNVCIQGKSSILLHAYNDVDVQIKAEAKRGSATKKTDNIEGYVKRNTVYDKKTGLGQICLPGNYLKASLCKAAKSHQDPSGRSNKLKTAHDLVKASILVNEELAPINGGVYEWETLDKRAVVVQRARIMRSRPCFLAGWTVACTITVLQPDLISHDFLLQLLQDAGNYCGVGDNRPENGRFVVTEFKQVKLK